MAEQAVTVPAVGKVNRKWVLAAAGVTAGIVGYAWWRRSAVPADALPPDDFGGDYASEAPGGPGVTSGYSPGSTTVTPDAPMPPRDNGEWTRRAIEYLGGIGYEPATVAATLGKYLGRQPLTQAEADLVRTALGSIGPPPVGTFPVELPGPLPAPAAPAAPAPAAPAPAPASSAGTTVTVAKWTARGAPWNSTVSGIASRYGVSSSTVWNHPNNAALRARRGAMNRIQPGDRVFVPAR